MANSIDITKVKQISLVIIRPRNVHSLLCLDTKYSDGRTFRVGNEYTCLAIEATNCDTRGLRPGRGQWASIGIAFGTITAIAGAFITHFEVKSPNLMSSSHRNDKFTINGRHRDIPWTGKLLLSWIFFTTNDICATDTLDTSNVSNLLRVEIDFSNQVILDIADHETVRTFWIQEVTDTLRH